MSPRTPLRTLVLGLALGLLGSYSDDLLGASAVVSLLQLALWILSAVVIVTALASMRGRRTIAPGALHPTV